MTTYKISPSLLEQWRNLRLGKYGLTPEKFLSGISEGFKPNEATSRGSAYHKLLEHGPDAFKIVSGGKTFYKVYEKDLDCHWVFSYEAAKPAIDIYEAMKGKPVVREMWGKWEGEIGGQKVFMRLRMDALLGTCLHEFKTTSRTPEYSDYAERVQWLCYMLAEPQLASLTYHIFTLNSNCSTCKYDRFDLPRPHEGYIKGAVSTEVNTMFAWLETHHPAHAQLLEMKEDKDPLRGL